MNRYRALCHVAVRHEYFADRRLPGLRLVPSAGTSRLFGGLGLLWRASAEGGSVFCADDRVEALRLVAAEAGEDLQLAFLGDVCDERFLMYTDASPAGSRFLFRFRSARWRGIEDGRARLHDAGHASVADVVAVAGSDWSGVLDRRRRKVPPDFVVDLRLGRSPEAMPVDELAASPVRFCIDFAAARTRWKYYLVGAHVDERYRITPAAGDIGFSDAVPERLADDSLALSFTSVGEIPMRERYSVVPQLRAGEPPDDRLLIRHLPVAGTDSQAAAGDGRESVSELYINY